MASDSDDQTPLSHGEGTSSNGSSEHWRESSLGVDSLSDEELAAGCVISDDKNRVAFEELIRRCFDAVSNAVQRALAKARSPIACDKNDLMQIFFTRVDENRTVILGRYLRSRGNLGHYLARIAYRHSIKELRKRRVNWPARCHRAGPGELQSVAAPQTAPNREHIVAQLLTTLDSTTRSMVQAKFGLAPFALPLPVKEIALMHGISDRSVHRKLATVFRHLLRRLLDSVDDDLD